MDEVRSFLRCASQLGSKVSISSCSSLRCSGFNVATHWSLLNFGVAVSGSKLPEFALDVADEEIVFGAPKKDVKLESFFGFLRSAAEAVNTSAFLLVAMGDR